MLKIVSSKSFKPGFTLVELLVVIVIIGILATLSVVALNNSKQKGRDARRVADVKQIQTALEVYYTDNGAYPQYLTAGQVFKDASGKTYLSKVPSNPTPATDGSCPSGDYSYVGPRTDANVYKIYYCLGGAVGSVAGGSCVARPGNICADYMPDPIATASLVRGTNGADLNWPLSMVVSGNYAYVGNYNSKSLEVFDISNLANPVHKAIIYGSAGVALNNISGMGISGNYLYALDGSSNAMEVVNISNPLSPSAVVKLSVTNGYQIANNIFVSGNYAYLTSNSAGCQNCYSSFRVVDISVPASANIKGSVNDGVGGAYLTDAAGVYVVGNYAYLAVRDGNTGGSIGGLEIIDVSNPIAPVHKSTLMNGSGGASLVHPNDIVVSGNYAYIATHGDSPFTGSKAPGLEIVNISNPSSPVHVGSILSGQGGAVFSNSGQKVLVQGNYAFIADPNDGIVEVVNVSNPSAPTHITTIGSSSGAALSNIAGMFLSNYNLYTVGGFQNNSLNVINLR